MRGGNDNGADYDLHGVHISVEAECSGVADALRRRLHHYRVSGGSASTDLRLRYSGGPISCPQGPHRDIYETPIGTVRYFPEADIVFAELGETRLHIDPRAGVAQASTARWTGARRYVAAHTMTTLALMELLKRRALFAVHVACLASQGKAVVIAGPSGAGKSTLALALARTGLDYLSDDLAFLQASAEDGGVIALGFADAIGVTAHTLELFPELAGLCSSAPDRGFPKHLLDVATAVNSRIVGAGDPCVIVFPEIVNSDKSQIEPLDPREAWRRLVPDVLLTEPAAAQAHLAAIAGLTEQVSCHRLRAGRDVHASARLVSELL